jgi:hypothetical protein
MVVAPVWWWWLVAQCGVALGQLDQLIVVSTARRSLAFFSAVTLPWYSKASGLTSDT